MIEPNIVPLERHRDQRGWVSEIYSGELDDEIRNIHLGTMTPGSIRGNHRHERTREWITFMQTPVTVRWGPQENFEEDVLEEPSTVELPVSLPHAFKNSGQSDVPFVAYTDTFYREENPDVEEVPLFPSD